MRFDLAALAAQTGTKRRVIECRPIEPRIGTEADYFRVLNRMLAEAAAFVRSDILPAVEAERAGLTRDALGDRLGSVFGSLRALLTRLVGAADTMVRNILDLEAQRHTDRFKETVRSAIGIDIGAVISKNDLSDLMSLAAQRNASLIKSLSEDVAKRVEQAALENLANGGTAKQLQQRLTEDFGIAKRRAKTIARDQTSKLTGDLNRFRQQQSGVEKYRWSTSRDERVRATHRANEGKIFSWDDPPATGHPGHEVNCRCTAIAIIEIDGVDFSSKAPQGEPDVWANPSVHLTPKQRARALREQRKYERLRQSA